MASSKKKLIHSRNVSDRLVTLLVWQLQIDWSWIGGRRRVDHLRRQERRRPQAECQLSCYGVLRVL